MELMDEFINFVNNWKAKNYFSTNPDGSLTEESLLKFLNDINAKINEIPFELQGNNARFYFYSNFVVKENSTGYSGYDYVSEVQIKDRNARSIYDTKAGRLFDGRLYDAIQRTVGSERLAYRLIGGLDWDNSSNSYVRSSPYGVDLGNGRKALSITDTISQLYAQRTIYGDVFIIMPNADTNSVLYQSELLSIINNPRVRSVNGESITNIKARYSSEGLLGVFNYLKSENAKLMDGLVKPDGKGGYDVNVDPFVKNPSEAWLNDYEKRIHNNKSTLESLVKTIDKMSIESKPLEAYIGKLKLNYSDATQLTRSVKIMESVVKGNGVVTSAVKQLGANNMALYMASRSGTMKALGVAGSVLLAIDAALTIKQAVEAYNKGDGYTGTKILHDWGWRTTFALGSATAAMQLGLPLALLAIAGSSLVLPASGAMLVGVLAELGLGILGWNAGSFIGGGVGDLVWSLMRQAGLLPARIDPIVLDISGQGITTKSITDGVYYDLDNNGFAEKTGWVDAKSGILVLDRDGNGKIEAGKELFGDRTILDDGKTASNGFAALAALDSNHDGVIDAKDVKFSELRIWVDKDGNGVSTPDELLTLEEAGIRSLNLSNTFIGKVDENGNTIARVGSFTRTDGTTADMKEFFLQRDTADVQMKNSVEVPEDIMNLPEIHPMGNTYSLRQAMARDTTGTLKQLVQDFMNAKDTSSRQAKLQDILFAWVGASQINPTSRGSSFDARKLAVLETVTGTSYRNSPTSSPTAAEAPILERSYTTLLESIYTMLSMQTSLADVFRKFNYSLDLESENPIKLDVSSVQAYLDEQLQSNAVTGEKMLAEITRALRNRGLISDAEFTHLREHFAKKSIKYQRIIDTAPLTTMTGTDAGDSINGVVDRDNVIAAGDGNDTLIGAARNDLLYGDAGNDTLYGYAGNDTLIGGQGKDSLRGGEGDDVYIFNKGDGEDNIEETKGLDTIQFGAGIKPDDVIAKVVSGSNGSANLELSIKNTNDKITVYRHFGYNNYGHEDAPNQQIEKVTFADSTVWTLEDIHAKAHNMSGTDKDDDMRVLDKYATTLHGLAGNDSLVGGIANDLLYGDAGDDTIYGMGGDDLLIGGEGTDQLHGREGNDTYIFSKGDGTDHIEETDGFDKIQFGEGILPEDVVLRVVWGSGNNLSLSITIKNTTDKIVVDGHFGMRTYNSDRPHISKPGNQIEQIIFSDGVSWDLSEIHRRAHDMVGTNNADYLVSFEDGAYTYHGLGGNDSVIGGFANDSLYGDEGNDIIYGFGGNDTLSGGTGNDQLRGGAGDDVYLFSRGDGVDYIEETDGFDTIQFGEGISPNDVIARVVSTEGNSISLELSITGTKDKITIHRHFGQYNYYQGDVASPGNQIERVMFADGTSWDLDEIHRRAHDMTGTDGNDNFNAVGDAPVIYRGLAGNDNISGRSGKDILYGDAGDDSISGGGTLIGGPGNDRIYGSKGDDVYIFNRGDGQDLITDTGGVDTIRFGDGIRPDDIVIKRVGNGYGHNLELCIKDTNDKVAVYEHFGTNSPWGSVDDPAVKIERVEFADGTVWTKEDIDDKMHNKTGTDEADTIEAYGKRGVVYHGLGGDDYLRGAAGDDKLYGEDGDDRISGGEGNDLIVGGRGNDIIESFRGDDTYVFNRGDGRDVITDYNGFDAIRFGEGIKPEDIVLKRVYVNGDWSLEISIKDTEDTVTFISHFDPTKPSMSSNHTLEQIKFADGTVWTKDDIDYKMHHLTGTENNDRLAAYDKARVVYHGRGGDDTLVGSEGNDELYGEDGDDILDGNSGNDVFVGGKGNDKITSIAGDDVYVFSRGDGQDTINDYNGIDTIRFGKGIRPEDIIISRVPWYGDYNLVLSFKDTDDKITVVSHFGSSNYSGYYATPQRKIERFEFDNGTVWTAETIDEKMHNLVGTDAKDNFVAYDDKPVTYYGMGGDDTLQSRKGNDILVGGTGNDHLAGDAGDDTYIFARGDGKDRVFDTGGNDTIRLGHTHAEVVFKKIYSTDLLLEMRGSSDSVQIQGWYGNSDRRIETIQAEDGYTIQPEKVQQLIQAMASFGNSHSMNWQQALEAHPVEAQSIISQYWTAPTA